MFEKLQTDYQRFLEIDQLLLDPKVAADAAQVAALSRERGLIAKIAIPYGRYLELSRQIAEAQQLCSQETDVEMLVRIDRARDAAAARTGRRRGAARLAL